MILDGLGPEEIMREAAGLPVEILEWKEVLYYCPCNKDRVLDALATLGEEEIKDLIRKEKAVDIQCQFCKKGYTVSEEGLSSLLKAMGF